MLRVIGCAGVLLTVAVTGATLVGCQRYEQPDAGFVFRTEHETGVVRDGAVVARLPIGHRDAGLNLTTDGRFIYSSDDTSISVVDTRSLQRRTIPCSTPCVYHPMGGSFVGRFDTGGVGGETTDYADVLAIDLALSNPRPETLGRVELAWPHPTDTRVSAYSFFLDAEADKYLFFDLAAGSPANPRPWEHPQRLYLASLNGSTEDLGRYAGFGHEYDVWGAISPDGEHAVVNSDVEQPGSSPPCDNASIDLVDTATGQISHIHPDEPAHGPQSFRINRAWWGADGTLYTNYQQWPCLPDSIRQPAPPPPSVWTYRDGQWSELDTGGPAVYALQLPGDHTAVVVPGPQYEMPRGALYLTDEDGKRTQIADDVTAIAELPASDAP